MTRLAASLRRIAAALTVTLIAIALACVVCWLVGLPYELGTALPVALLVVVAWWQVFAAVWETAISWTGGR